MIVTNENPTVKKLMTKFKRMEGSRGNWETLWQEIADFVIPNKDDIYKSKVSGEKKNNRVYTGMPINTNEVLASALHGMLTNPASVWLGFTSGDPMLDENPLVKEWIQHVVDTIIRTLNNSNFQTQIHEVYVDLGAFGTGLMLIEEDDDFVIRFLSRPIYMAYIEEDHRGIVDTIAFERMRTARQIKQEFGESALTEDMKRDMEMGKDDDRTYTVIHMVAPREFFDTRKKNKKNKKFGSYHFIKENGQMLRESGFDEMPYVVPRWSKISGEKYGRSPAMKALSDIKMLNAMKKAVIQGAQKVVNPPLQAPDDGFLMPLRTGPGDVNYFRSGSRDRIEPILTGARPDLGEGIITQVEDDIKRAFFIDQLQIREADRMTATEIIQRREEQLRKLGPILGRMHFELLQPLVERVFNILMRQGVFKPQPAVLAGKNLDVKFVSQIAKAQTTSDADDLTRVIGLISPLAQVNPAVLDSFNGDKILQDLANKFNLPADYLRTQTAVSNIRQGRAEEQQKMNEMDDAERQVDIASKAANIQG